MNSNKKLILAVLIFVVLGIIAASDVDSLEHKSFYSTVDDTGKSNRSYYQASISTSRDPKDAYNDLVKLSIVETGTRCNTNRIMSSDTTILPNSGSWYSWITESTAESWSQIQTNGLKDSGYISVDGFKITGLYSDGEKIVVPMSEMSFVDSNINYGNQDNICIKVAGGNYKLEFHNVESWWCHMSSDVHTRHDTVVGLNGEAEDIVRGQIIGTATANTVVYIYVLDSLTKEWLPSSFFTFYNIQ